METPNSILIHKHSVSYLLFIVLRTSNQWSHAKVSCSVTTKSSIIGLPALSKYFHLFQELHSPLNPSLTSSKKKFFETCLTLWRLMTYIYVVVGSKSFRPDIQKPRQMENTVRDIYP